MLWWLLTRARRSVSASASPSFWAVRQGNLVDRMVRGAVTDWIHLAPYPPYFNVADVAIRGGLICHGGADRASASA